jgi:hypothetical protein
MLATFIVRSGKGLLGGAAGSVFAVFAEAPGGVSINSLHHYSERVTVLGSHKVEAGQW